MVEPWQAALFRWIPYPLRRRIQPAKATHHKRDTWIDAAAFRVSCARSGLYDALTPEAMDAFVASALVPSADGVTLAFPKAWEAHFYSTPPFPRQALANIRVPAVGLRGAPSMFLDDSRWRRCTALLPSGWFRELADFGHLLPLEGPAETASAIVEGLAAVGLHSPASGVG